MEGSGRNRASTLSWFVKTVRSGERFPDGTLPAEVWKRGGVSPTLNLMDNTGESRATVVAVTGVLGDVAHTLTSDGSDGSEDGTGRGTPIVTASAGDARTIVRRLTPIEVERLQGLPDGWTEWGVDEDGNRVDQADSTRYRQCGNGVAVPCVQWVTDRLVAVELGLL